MDSKLPKPSGLKKPTPVFKGILPSDRIKAGQQAGAQSALNKTTAFVPLSRDLSNIPEMSSIRFKRAASPELRTTQTAAVSTRGKLRRSRSFCDMRNLASSGVPNKMMRLMAASNSVASTSKNAAFSNSSLGNRPARFGIQAAQKKTGTTATTTTTAAAGFKAANNRTNATATRAGSAPPAGAAAARTGTVKKAATNATAVSTTGAGKPINKRIPPYDFKARYNDLLEKHKVLKEKYELKCEQMGNLESMPDQLEESQSKLYSTQEQLKNEQTQNECLRRQVESQNNKLVATIDSLAKANEELAALKKAHEKICKEHAAFSAEVIELRARTAQLAQHNEHLQSELDASKDQLFHANIERKELHNTIMDLRGNIRVFCRVRPPLDTEQEKLVCNWNYIDEATLEIQNPNKNGAHMFQFDQVFHHQSTQQEIFEMVSPLIQSALDGYNICIFAYGQTGSGKTYTMDGIDQQPGIIPRTVELLFDAVKNYKRLGWEYEIRVNFLEIYNEVLYDLLSNEQKDMEIRMVKNSKNDIYVSNITEELVESAGRLQQLMLMAKMNRATASTIGNERSSRSHAVTKIVLIGTHSEKNEISVGTINLVDLAGSESPKTSIRMNETKNINRSLAELSNVILALLQKKDHVPYRNSKLTHLLMPSLGGNSKTLMFINVAPLLDCYDESVKSLRFAASVNSCTMAKAKRNKFINNTLMTNTNTSSF